MKRSFLAGILLVATPLAALAAQDWNITFTRTDRGHLLGNPEAEIQLISFVSYSCSHCAQFDQQSDAPLRLAYVQTGRVGLELRHVIRNPIDLAAALTSECGAEDKFWGNHRAILRDQDRWLEVAVEATPAQSQRWMSGSIGSRMRAIASDLDFYELMEPRGYSVAQLDRCLTDEAAAQEIAGRAQSDNEEFAVPGTPSFAINGSLLPGVHGWTSLQAALDAPLAPDGE